MDAGLDFVVGGIPRSGTTAFADALNQHPAIYCHASEMNVLPFAADIACHAPVKPDAGVALRGAMRRELEINLVDNVAFNLAMGSPAPAFRLDANTLDGLAGELVESLQHRLSGPAYARQVSAILARMLRQKSGKDIVGEKSPANVLALDRFSALDAGALPSPMFLTVREPFGVIRSMQARLANPLDVAAADFAGSVTEQAGLYVKYALASARMAERGATLFRYETLCGNPWLVFRRVLDRIRVKTTDRLVNELARTIECGTSSARSHFSPAEQAAIDAICGPVMRRLCYPQQAASLARQFKPYPGWRVLAGRYHDNWLEQRSVLMLAARPQQTRARLHIWQGFPQGVVGPGRLATWTAHGMDGRTLGKVSTTQAGPLTLALDLDLAPGTVQICANGLKLVLVELACSRSFMPMAHLDGAGVSSADVRALSGMLEEVELF